MHLICELWRYHTRSRLYAVWLEVAVIEIVRLKTLLLFCTLDFAWKEGKQNRAHWDNAGNAKQQTGLEFLKLIHAFNECLAFYRRVLKIK